MIIDGLKTFYARGRFTAVYIFLFPALFILSIVYFGMIGLVKLMLSMGLLRSYRSSRRVISVGNITLGGTGKTPLVEYVARFLSQNGHKPAVLLRGYKKPKQATFSGSADFEVLGDEASMLKENLRGLAEVLSGPDRVTNAKYVDREGDCDTIILDDGFQHWRLKRDLDIVTVDAANPFGNRLLLPAGHLREPITALKRAHVFCLTHADRVSKEDLKELQTLLLSIRPDALVIRALHEPDFLHDLKTGKTYGVEVLRDAKVGIFCGIGNPLSFVRTVEKNGARILLKRFFDDHEIFSKGALEDFAIQSHALGIEKILTTQKDAQRLAGLFRKSDPKVSILILRISLKIIEGKEALDERLRALYRS